MHDIICPNCGESFIASDVAFDLSEYVVSLLCSDPKDLEDVKSVGFKFFTDEDTIRKHTMPGNDVPLLCESSMGPGMAGPWYPFVVTNQMLIDYMASELNMGSMLEEILDEVQEIQGTRGATYTIRHLEALQAVYYRFFSVARKGSDDFSMDDENVQIAVKILSFMAANKELTTTLKVRLYCAKHNPKENQYRVPDVLFVLKNGINSARHIKCCRYCGSKFPDEFGYYKMMPVVLLGSHYSGKTSYLLSLLYTITSLPPFSHDGTGARSIIANPLHNDDNLEAFSKNIEQFKRGEDPNKTDFKNVPILNLLVNDVIYSFIDWPGEKFINSDARNDANFVYETKRVIMKARHFLCFLEPSQIDLNRIEAEEKVRFDAYDLAHSFDWHMSLPEGKGTVRSITYVVNKIDLFAGDAQNPANPNAQPVLELARSKNETDVFSNKVWHENEFKNIDSITQNFLQVQHPNLLAHLNSMTGFEGVVKAYVPVAPYGESRAKAGNNVVHRTRLAGVPLLRIIEQDKKLIRK